MQWSFEGNGWSEAVISGDEYRLFNLQSREKLVRKKKQGSKPSHLALASNGSFLLSHIFAYKRSRGPIRYGDVVGINVAIYRHDPYGWLIYKNGRIGINSNKKGISYEWKLTGGKNGRAIRTKMPFSLRNIKGGKGEYVRSCKRTDGIDLGWQSSKCEGLLPWDSNTLWGKKELSYQRNRFCRFAYDSDNIKSAADKLKIGSRDLFKIQQRVEELCVKGLAVDEDVIKSIHGGALSLAIFEGQRLAIKDGVKPIPTEIKKKLSKYFPKHILDKAFFRTGDSLTSGWPAAITLNFETRAAVILDDVIVFKAKEKDISLPLWAHQLKHVQYYDSVGVISYASSYLFAPHVINKQADAIAQRVRTDLLLTPFPIRNLLVPLKLGKTSILSSSEPNARPLTAIPVAY